MAMTVARVCDFPVRGKECGKPAALAYEGRFTGQRLYGADFCEKHRDEFETKMLAMGVRPLASLTDNKARGVHMAASGATFSTHDAREWLVAQGLISGGAAGRVSKAMLQLYAESH